MNTWILKKGEDRRLKAGHPWVFSNELSSSPKSIVPGELVEIVDQRGNFIARGYGNPHSLIAFRAVTWTQSEQNILSLEYVKNKLIRAWQLRSISGLKQSFRLCYGEADGLPGLVIDRYITEQGIVFVVQLLTYGMQKFIGELLIELFDFVMAMAYEQGLTVFKSSQMAVVLRNDVNVRRLEGLEVEEPKIVLNRLNVELSSIDIALDSMESEHPIWMSVDLEKGQKTGFFLDQRGNIFQVLRFIQASNLPFLKVKRVRVLDLCCYVGHWSTQLVRYLTTNGCFVEVTLLDISKDALNLAVKNVQRAGGINCQVTAIQSNVLESLHQFADGQFDVVIADPPAFIKARKDIPTGTHAYLKLNTQAFRLVSHKGMVISCSCSGLLSNEDFQEVLRKAQVRQSCLGPAVIWGGHSPDHPVLMSFPEGAYLKMIGHLKF